MIDGFEQRFIDIEGVSLSVHTGGRGAPLLMLHGYPQNHATWGRVAPEFAKRFFCVVPDLRGYGESSVPPSDAQHMAYSKRQMAADMLALMQVLGYSQFNVLGHDRGARVAYRLALDSNAVLRLGIIEVVPTGDMWQHFDAHMALSAFHWTFLAQPYPLPETLINANPVYFLEHLLSSWVGSGSLSVFDEMALESYRVQMTYADRVHAMCEDYRAGATIDRQLDLDDQRDGKRIESPMYFLWANEGFPASTGEPLALWQRWANEVEGHAINSGHFAQEENPTAVVDAFIHFF